MVHLTSTDLLAQYNVPPKVLRATTVEDKHADLLEHLGLEIDDEHHNGGKDGYVYHARIDEDATKEHKSHLAHDANNTRYMIKQNTVIEGDPQKADKLERYQREVALHLYACAQDGSNHRIAKIHRALLATTKVSTTFYLVLAAYKTPLFKVRAYFSDLLLLSAHSNLTLASSSTRFKKDALRWSIPTTSAMLGS
jgi:hypothetical protein